MTTPGIFDSGIFDSGIFDVEVVEVVVTPPDFNPPFLRPFRKERRQMLISGAQLPSQSTLRWF